VRLWIMIAVIAALAVLMLSLAGTGGAVRLMAPTTTLLPCPLVSGTFAHHEVAAQGLPVSPRC